MSIKLTSLEKSLAEYTAWANRLAENSNWVTSENPPPSPRSPEDQAKDRIFQVRRKKQDLLKRFATGGKIVEIEWALEHQVFMTKEQMLDYLDHTAEDPDLEPIEYMHDKGFTSDGMLKGLFKRLVGLGLSKADIMGIIKNGDQGKPASPGLISRIAGQVLRSDEITPNETTEGVDPVINQKFPEPRPATPEEINRGYVYSKSHHLGNDGMVYYFKDPRGYSKQPTKTIDEGEKDYAYHRAKERHHEKEGDKAMARANSFGAYAHPQGISARKKAEQHYAKADEHRSAWKELGSVPVQESAMKKVNELYNDWMSSEFAPFDSDSGDDREVIRKAESFLRGQVAPEKIESYAEMLADQFHGGAPGVDSLWLEESKRIKILAGI